MVGWSILNCTLFSKGTAYLASSRRTIAYNVDVTEQAAQCLSHAHSHHMRATPPGQARAVADRREPEGVLEGAQEGEPGLDDALSSATALMLSRRAALTYLQACAGSRYKSTI